MYKINTACNFFFNFVVIGSCERTTYTLKANLSVFTKKPFHPNVYVCKLMSTINCLFEIQGISKKKKKYYISLVMCNIGKYIIIYD